MIDAVDDVILEIFLSCWPISGFKYVLLHSIQIYVTHTVLLRSSRN